VDQEGRVHRIRGILSVKGMVIEAPSHFDVETGSGTQEDRAERAAVIHAGRISGNFTVRSNGTGMQRVEIEPGNELKAGIDPVVEIGLGVVMYAFEMTE